MKREIKFRGLWVDGKGWAYGMYVEMFNRCYIIEPILGGRAEQHHVVSPKTIGQFTGLKDKNGKEIYEGDIIRFIFFTYLPSGEIESEKEGEVIFKSNAFMFSADEFYPLCNLNFDSEADIEVIRNIHEQK